MLQLGPGSFQGPRRFLEWAKPIDLYYQYVATCDAENRRPASLTTFMKLLKQVFAKHLHFRDKSSFAQCNVCYHLRQRLPRRLQKTPKRKPPKLYPALAKSMARQTVLLNARKLSRLFFDQGNLMARGMQAATQLCVIIDGMDQSKLRCPRQCGRFTKTMERLFRPSLHICACWIHGRNCGSWFKMKAAKRIHKPRSRSCHDARPTW